MRKFLCLIILLPFLAFAQTQTQQGYVKTKGRLNSNGTITPGVRLSGATVVLKSGNSVVSGTDGAFSMSLKNNKYHLDSVQKKGYVLTDPEILKKTYSYSTNPLIISMETPDTRSADKLANERKIRRTLQRTLQQKEDEIEALKEQNKITEKEYRDKLQKLYDDQSKNEKLISEMAERYSKIDYDQINDFDREFNQYILNGELTKADSLLNTKGDINARINELNKNKQILEEEEKELAQRQDNLEKGKAYFSQKLEDIANDCYKKHERFKIEYNNDSAAYYLVLRASLDTTNILYQLEAGNFFTSYHANYDKALKYYNCALQNATIQYGSTHIYTSIFYSNIGYILSHKGKYDDAISYYKKALEIQLNNLGEEHPNIACSYNNIGTTYLYQSKYNEAITQFQKALEISLKVLGDEHPEVAIIYSNIGSIYSSQGKYNEALIYYNKALEIRIKAHGDNHPNVATSYNNIGQIYNYQGFYDEALIWHQKALKIQLRVLGKTHPDIASSYNNIGLIYANKGKYEEALNYFQKALEIILQHVDENHPNVQMVKQSIEFVKSKIAKNTN